MLHLDRGILVAGEPFKMRCVGKTYLPSGHVQMMMMTRFTLYGYPTKCPYQEMKVDLQLSCWPI